MNDAFYAAQQAATSPRICTRLVLLKIVNVSRIIFIYSNKITYKLYSVSTKRKMVFIRNTLAYCLWLYHHLFNGIYAKVSQEIYYNICRIIKKVFDGICDGLNIIETNLIKIKL